MQINPLQRQVQAADVPFERLAGNSQVSEAAKVTEVSRQFEAVLLRQILGDAQKKIFASTMNPDSVAGGVYQDMITNQLADSISRSGGFGLAHALEKQLQHEFKSTQPATDGGSKV
ncbi:MAG: rod-binding protein [Verrucomicrobiota bacterium]